VVGVAVAAVAVGEVHLYIGQDAAAGLQDSLHPLRLSVYEEDQQVFLALGAAVYNALASLAFVVELCGSQRHQR